MTLLHTLLLPAILAILGVQAEIHVPLTRRTPITRTEKDFKALRESTLAKFSRPKGGARKRASSADVPLTNLGFDTTYFGTVQIGSNSKSFNVILDTGSSDLFIASSSCQSCVSSGGGGGGGGATLSPSDSSTLQVSQSQVDLKFGSGETIGNLAQDKVTMGGFTVSNQTFVLSTDISQGLLQGSLSGLLGLGFETIAQTQATPFVEALANGNALGSPEMAFYLDRLINVANAQEEAPGGTFTIGGTNSSLFQGDIDFVNIPSLVEPSFWLLPVTQVGIQGQTLSVTSGTTSLAAIDTGTTLIGGPTNAVASVYSNVKGAQNLTGDMEGYWSIPCDSPVSMSFTFSSKTWSINPIDFTVQQLQGNTCLGALFELNLGGQGSPDWVIGDSFLKNVYSVYRFKPPSVGFAQLASNLEGSPPSSPSTSLPKSSSSPPPAPTVVPTSSLVDGSSSAAAPAASKTVTGGGGPLPTASGGSSTVAGSNPFQTGGALGLQAGIGGIFLTVALLLASLLGW